MKQHFIFLLVPALFFFHSGCANSTDTISSAEIIQRIQKKETIEYSHVAISGDLDFTALGKEVKESPDIIRIYACVPVTFSNCTFLGKVITGKKEAENNYLLTFMKNLSFIHCGFKDEVVFRNTEARGNVYFNNSRFNKNADFQGITFRGRDCYFSECVFTGTAQFQRAVFRGNVNLMHTRFDKYCSFQHAAFYGNALFGGITCVAYADFSHAVAHGNFIISQSVFAEDKSTVFSNAVFHARADFSNCRFNGVTEINDVFFHGITSFTQCEIVQSFNLSNSVFIAGKPLAEKTLIHEKALIKTDETYYNDQKKIELSDFNQEKP
jgi:uncharacterized protein YjbI with pentapeptide repeats